MDPPRGDQPRTIISKTIDFHVASNRGHGRPAQFTTRTSCLSHTKQVEVDRAAEARAIETLNTLSSGSKRKLNELSGGIIEDGADHGPPLDDAWEDEDEEPMDPEIELSAEGGEAEHLLEYVGSYKRKAMQTNASQIKTASIKWNEQLPDLIDVYLQWQHDPLDAKNLQLSTFALLYINVFMTKNLHHLPNCKYMNTTLLHQGCLGPMPDFIYIAFSLHTLELYHCLHIRQPRLSIQAWVRVICDAHNATYNKTLWHQFSNTFDVYLKILQGVCDHVDGALGQTEPDWRVRHSCPPCQYKLVEEPELEVSIMGAIDGNSSLNDYFISAQDVDHFKNDVKSKSSGQGSTWIHTNYKWPN
ncbi:hypothetical protein EWM64_g5975 [Hericium alpestre]|uniref:CxC1-like cysteine cluster associated with KDZ transposases domain-containing protein n=1 Tax=Hericium alpestre TaxID=135208 RepID=A0A4Y9ZVF8_9AGAM|nr:hypothetical protein EWM64_g5975 [Hericium alpestre]